MSKKEEAHYWTVKWNGNECGTVALDLNQGELLSIKERFRFFRAFYPDTDSKPRKLLNKEKPGSILQVGMITLAWDKWWVSESDVRGR